MESRRTNQVANGGRMLSGAGRWDVGQTTPVPSRRQQQQTAKDADKARAVQINE